MSTVIKPWIHQDQVHIVTKYFTSRNKTQYPTLPYPRLSPPVVSKAATFVTKKRDSVVRQASSPHTLSTNSDHCCAPLLSRHTRTNYTLQVHCDIVRLPSTTSCPVLHYTTADARKAQLRRVGRPCSAVTMGGQVSKIMGKIFGSKEMRLLMLGLDAAGKTSPFPPLSSVSLRSALPRISNRTRR